MTRRSRKSQNGFTLVEVLVATVLVAVGVVSALGGIRNIQKADAQMRDADLLQRLAVEKLNDLRYQTDPTQLGTGGNFSDRGYSDVTWSADVATTSTTNLDQVTVTATRGTVSQSVTTMMFVQPRTTTSTSTTSGSGA